MAYAANSFLHALCAIMQRAGVTHAQAIEVEDKDPIEGYTPEQSQRCIDAWATSDQTHYSIQCERGAIGFISVWGPSDIYYQCTIN